MKRHDWIMAFIIVLIAAFLGFLMWSGNDRSDSFAKVLNPFEPFVESEKPPQPQSEQPPDEALKAKCVNKGEELRKYVIQPYDDFKTSFTVCVSEGQNLHVEVRAENEYHQSEKLIVTLQRAIKGVWEPVNREVIYKSGEQAWDFTREFNGPLKPNTPYRLLISNDNRHDVELFVKMEAR